jgi:hypothetical protein
LFAVAGDDPDGADADLPVDPGPLFTLEGAQSPYLPPKGTKTDTRSRMSDE